MSISAMEIQGDTHPPSMQPGNGGLSEKSPSPIPDISLESTSEGEKTLERLPTVSGKEECRRATTAKGSTCLGRGGRGIASGKTAVKKGLVEAIDKRVVFPEGESGIGTKGPPHRKTRVV